MIILKINRVQFLEGIMNFTWIFGLFLLTSHIQPFTLIDDDETLSEVERSNFILHVPGLEILNTQKVEDYLTQIDSHIQRKPYNATIDDIGRIIPERVGYTLNKVALRKQLFTYFYEYEPSIVKVPKIAVYPKIDSELLSHIRTKRIGQYFTYYNPHNQSRSHNIQLATAAINNQVLFPGEVFSFNQVVGKRTIEKGYMKAREIVKGEFTEGIGGGICQVSSTLFNAIDSTGMTILERYSHSRNVNYVPQGRDATVSWYGPDFSFKNEYNQPILIRAHARRGQVSIFIYSSEDINYVPKNIYSILPKSNHP